jgi:L-serine deaminase
MAPQGPHDLEPHADTTLEAAILAVVSDELPADRSQAQRSSVYACMMCDRTFSSPVNLKAHHNAHFGVLFPCVIAGCRAKFPHHGNLQRHIRTVHKKREEKNGLPPLPA